MLRVTTTPCHRHRASPTVSEDTTVTVAGVGTEADVTGHRQARVLGLQHHGHPPPPPRPHLDPPDGPQDRVALPRPGAALGVLRQLTRHAEQQDGGQAVADLGAAGREGGLGGREGGLEAYMEKSSQRANMLACKTQSNLHNDH